VAAALAIATHIQARLAAILLGVMFLTWFSILHLPRVFAAPHNGNEWSSAFVALAMAGAAFLLAANVTDRVLTGRTATYFGHVQRPSATREFHPLYSILRAEDFVPQPERKALPSHQFEPSFRESL
jgi:hypothetical protein